MSFRTFHCARSWFEQGLAAFVVEVGEALGSTPRDAGTRMLVSLGEVAGTMEAAVG